METNSTEHRPLYTHDCDKCLYLGSRRYECLSDARVGDVYSCVGTQNHVGPDESIIVRWKDKHEFYSSESYFVFYLKRYQEEEQSENIKKFLVPYLFGLEQGKERKLLLKEET